MKFKKKRKRFKKTSSFEKTHTNTLKKGPFLRMYEK